MLLGSRDEVANGGENHGRWFPSGKEMEEDRNAGGRESRQGPRMKEVDHATREDVESASRSTMP